MVVKANRKVSSLLELFPHLSVEEAEDHIASHNGNVQRAAEDLLASRPSTDETKWTTKKHAPRKVKEAAMVAEPEATTRHHNNNNSHRDGAVRQKHQGEHPQQRGPRHHASAPGGGYSSGEQKDERPPRRERKPRKESPKAEAAAPEDEPKPTGHVVQLATSSAAVVTSGISYADRLRGVAPVVVPVAEPELPAAAPAHPAKGRRGQKGKGAAAQPAAPTPAAAAEAQPVGAPTSPAVELAAPAAAASAVPVSPQKPPATPPRSAKQSPALAPAEIAAAPRQSPGVSPSKSEKPRTPAAAPLPPRQAYDDHHAQQAVTAVNQYYGESGYMQQQAEPPHLMTAFDLAEDCSIPKHILMFAERYLHSVRFHGDGSAEALLRLDVGTQADAPVPMTRQELELVAHQQMIAQQHQRQRLVPYPAAAAREYQQPPTHGDSGYSNSYHANTQQQQQQQQQQERQGGRLQGAWPTPSGPTARFDNPYAQAAQAARNSSEWGRVSASQPQQQQQQQQQAQQFSRGWPPSAGGGGYYGHQYGGNAGESPSNTNNSGRAAVYKPDVSSNSATSSASAQHQQQQGGAAGVHGHSGGGGYGTGPTIDEMAYNAIRSERPPAFLNPTRTGQGMW